MPNPPTINFELDRNWILGGYSAGFLLRCELSPRRVSEALDLVARTVTAHLCTETGFGELRNIKGRDPHEAPLLGGAPIPSGEELLTIGGSIATGAAPHDSYNNHGRVRDFIWEPFNYSCYSRFDRFEGSRTIIHSVQTQSAATVPPWLPWWLLGAAAPIEPRYFRLGLEFFSSRFVITRLSFTPIVTDTFLIDCVDTTLALKLKTEQPYWKPCNPFEKIALLRVLSEGFEKITGLALPTLFANELAKRGNLRAG